MMLSWLINPMKNEIGENFLLLKMAKEICDTARGTYSKINNSELSAIESTLHDLRQGDLMVNQHFNALMRNWQQLDVYEEQWWHCLEYSLQYRRIIGKLYKFLPNLNKEVDDIRGRILGGKPSHSLHEAFVEVCMEESRKKSCSGIQHIPRLPKVGTFCSTHLATSTIDKTEKEKVVVRSL